MLLQYRNINFNISLINISQRHLLYTPLFYSKLLLKFFMYFLFFFFFIFCVFFLFYYASGTYSHSSDLAFNFTLSLPLTIRLFLISFTTGYVPPWKSIPFMLIAIKTFVHRRRNFYKIYDL